MSPPKEKFTPTPQTLTDLYHQTSGQILNALNNRATLIPLTADQQAANATDSINTAAWYLEEPCYSVRHPRS
ncbi:MAG: hypothetical protein WC596_02570 [Candidatus Shapirobacteria bacterium]